MQAIFNCFHPNFYVLSIIMFDIASHVRTLSSSDFSKKSASPSLKKAGKAGILLVYAPWCPHCHAVEEAWKGLARRVAGKYNVYAMNADDNKETCEGIKVAGYPSFFNVSRSGKFTKVNVDDRSEDNLVYMLESHGKKDLSKSSRKGPTKRIRRKSQVKGSMRNRGSNKRGRKGSKGKKRRSRRK